jgi:GntR family transcriptional regulator
MSAKPGPAASPAAPVAPLSAGADETTPLYQSVAHGLEQAIERGDYPVGGLLPTEAVLAGQLGVSRHTLRQAMALLRRRGLVSARKGVGTRVEAQSSDWRTRFRAESRNDLFDFARDTELPFVERGVVSVTGRMASEMGCRPGRKWLYLAGPRHFVGEDRPFCWNEVYLDNRLAGVVRDMDCLRVALFQLVEQATGDRILEIQQDMRPVMMSDHIADQLQMPRGEMALQLTRRYFASGRRLLEYAVQTLPASRFVYRTWLRSDDA